MLSVTIYSHFTNNISRVASSFFVAGEDKMKLTTQSVLQQLRFARCPRKQTRTPTSNRAPGEREAGRPHESHGVLHVLDAESRAKILVKQPTNQTGKQPKRVNSTNQSVAWVCGRAPDRVGPGSVRVCVKLERGGCEDTPFDSISCTFLVKYSIHTKQ